MVPQRRLVLSLARPWCGRRKRADRAGGEMDAAGVATVIGLNPYSFDNSNNTNPYD